MSLPSLEAFKQSLGEHPSGTLVTRRGWTSLGSQGLPPPPELLSTWGQPALALLDGQSQKSAVQQRHLTPVPGFLEHRRFISITKCSPSGG